MLLHALGRLQGVAQGRLQDVCLVSRESVAVIHSWLKPPQVTCDHQVMLESAISRNRKLRLL